MLPLEGRVAVSSFITASLLTICQFFNFFQVYWHWTYTLIIWSFLSLGAFLVPYSPIVKRASFLGIAFGASICLIYSTTLLTFGMYIASLSFFHFSEYIMTCIYNSKDLSLDSFLLNHSFEYKVAAVASWVEFLVEAYFFPGIKTLNIISISGLFLVVCGELLRKLAMVTAGSNFRHIVQTEKAQGHHLVKVGVYKIMRHPSYSGWFCWSVGTQMLLCNPICLIGYALASWQFFHDRIREEEYYLLQFFGEDYAVYMTEVGTGVPFVSGLEKEVKELAKTS